MYPLSAILVGTDETVLPHVRRELLNADVRVEAGYRDADHAVEAVRPASGGRHLFVLHLPSAADLPGLRRLSGTFVGQPVLALVGPGGDANLLIGAMRGGAAQVVPLPLLPEDFKAALDCIAVQQGPSTASTLIAVTGVTGGCGATTLAVNLAYEIGFGHQVPTVLLDLSLRMGMLAAYLNVEPRHTTSDLLRDAERLDVYMVQQALTKVADNFHILAGPHRAITPLEPTVEGVRRLIDFTRQLARVVVLDVPSTYDALYFEALAVADRAVLVGEQSVPSIRALSLLRDTLRREAPDLVQHPVINRYDPDREGFRAAELAEFLRVHELVTIPDDGAVLSAALDAGRPIRLQSPDSPALEAIDSLARVVAGPPTQQPLRPTSPSFLTRVVRRLGLA